MQHLAIVLHMSCYYNLLTVLTLNAVTKNLLTSMSTRYAKMVHMLYFILNVRMSSVCE